MNQQPQDEIVSAGAPAPDSALLLDQFLPRYDFAVVDARALPVRPDECYRVACEVDLFRHPVIRILLSVRSLPQRLGNSLAWRGPGTAEEAPPRTFRLLDMVRPPINWLFLGEEPNVELVLGQISRPWKAIAASNEQSVTPASFFAFNQAGFAKIALSLRVVPHGVASCILTIETRVTLTDPESLRRFRHYWCVIGPFSSLVRRIALQMIAADLRLAHETVNR